MTAYQVQTGITGRRGGNSGFTLVELLVVTAILGVLIAIAIGTYNSYLDKAKRTITVSSLNTIRKNLEFYYDGHQNYPPDIDFSTGKDSNNRTVFDLTLLEQINADMTPILYNSATNSYTFTARAKDSALTLYTLTPDSLAH